MSKVPTHAHLPMLDGLRFFAALFVAMAHYYEWILGTHGITLGKASIPTLAGIGMALFFVLSGFVIHYNYHGIMHEKGGIRRFAIARFTRLYPLYITLFVLEFALVMYFGKGSCGEVGNNIGLLYALPLFLTLTQSWGFGFICNNSFIYQYLMMSAVAWSISVEVFFYLLYPLLLKGFIRVRYAVMMYALTIAVCVLCYYTRADIDMFAQSFSGARAATSYNYQDSLLRWLVYFNPLINLASFLCGAVAAELILTQRAKTPSYAVIAICTVVAVHGYVYGWFGARPAVLTYVGHHLYIPVIALVLYWLAVDEKSMASRFLGNSFFVRLGEASYSIYLLHAFLFYFPRVLYPLGLNPWVIYGLWLLMICAVSRASYLLFERPVQRYLRTKIQPSNGILRCHHDEKF